MASVHVASSQDIENATYEPVKQGVGNSSKYPFFRMYYFIILLVVGFFGAESSHIIALIHTLSWFWALKMRSFSSSKCCSLPLFVVTVY